MLKILLILISFMLLNFNNLISFKLFNFIMIELKFDLVNSFFYVVVILISMFIKMYSKSYFEKIFINFSVNLNIFILSMLILILSNDFVSMLISWDGLGISSFFLVSYYLNFNSVISSVVTFFFNRLGDSMILMFIFIFLKFNNFNFFITNYYIFFLFVLGLFTKSSQLPFGVWLPMAMAAPTPISSLVHSSTLVTSGIFILIKLKYMMFFEIKMLILVFSILTFVLGGMFSFFSNDLKKSIAFSTLSQMGFIMFSLISGMEMLSFLHLMFHAFFKSSIFINFGFFMMFNFSIQDQKIFKTFNFLFLPKIIFVLNVLNLMGLILTLGFFSKDIILINFFSNMSKMFILFMLYFGCLMTCLYSMKFMMMFFLNTKENKNFFMNLNLNFSGIFINFLILNLFSMLFMNFFMVEILIILKNFKFMFYMIIFFGFMLLKMFSSNMMKNIMISMFMILDFFNFLNNKLFNMFNISLFFLFIEEKSQKLLINKLFSFFNILNLNILMFSFLM